ncbi:hypothetical protein F441_00415 [Phytophthora nicotianae CJ01A1]|uniref:Uncharacterized protein n=4 Tax=Phytophthora nicotianae TaxID=4792 RepID=W3A6X4_PHYNI|nr:hypothetical protein L915_00390 [Phytophthora nicotianae]ETL50354.1 hypothetical protein L916_00390 [Phytophthora nicotianae]ETO85989.1 hypothetical protein F444_00417 [Phytophthora nicotianae P1976]ETP27022.1 hypothetical protein F441_00415 [Phytophthora nicotianae CJ01A1]ETP54980.1 hypothetical protein F442_00412 [Phytophthora nicotianae P10297]
MDFEDPELRQLDQGDWVKDHDIGCYDNMVELIEVKSFRSGHDPAFSSMYEWILQILNGEA